MELILYMIAAVAIWYGTYRWAEVRTTERLRRRSPNPAPRHTTLDPLDPNVAAASSQLALANEALVRERAERDKVIDRLQRLNELKQVLVRGGGLDETLRAATEKMAKLFDLDFCRVWLARPGDVCDTGCVHAAYKDGPHACHDRTQCLHLMASAGTHARANSKMHDRVPFGSYRIGRVGAGEAKKFLTNDITGDPRVANPEWATQLGLMAFAGYKLSLPKGDPMGVLAFFARHPISPEEDALFENISSSISEAIRTAQAEDMLRQLAQLDGLTGVPNRRTFDTVLRREWKRQERGGLPLSLIMADVDSFKAYNDYYGHQAGDDALKGVASAMAAALRRPSDLLARYGGEEFAVLLPNTPLEGAVAVAETMRKRLAALAIPHERSAAGEYVTASFGVAASSLDAVDSGEALVSAADAALYRAKTAGRNRVCEG